jgi:hypothetical protein
VVIIIEKKLLKSLNRLEWGGPTVMFRWDGLAQGESDDMFYQKISKELAKNRTNT